MGDHFWLLHACGRYSDVAPWSAKSEFINEAGGGGGRQLVVGMDSGVRMIR